MTDTEDVPRFYINAVQVHASAYDAMFEFGFRGAPDRGQPGKVEPVCEIVMSLGHAKAMLPILAKLIAAYEDKVGKIPAPGYEEKSKE